MRGPAIAACLFLAACGGGVDGPPSSTSSASSSGANTDSSEPPSSTSPPATSASGATEQESQPAPSKIADPPSPGANGVPFHLVLSHHAPKHQPIQMRVAIDGTAVVSGSLSDGKTYTFDFSLAPGAHQIEAQAKHSIHETTETFALDAPSERWAVLNASAGRCDPCGPASMTWEVKTTP